MVAIIVIAQAQGTSAAKRRTSDGVSERDIAQNDTAPGSAGLARRTVAQSRPRLEARPPTQPPTSTTKARPTTNHSKPVTSFVPMLHMPA
jgi:hypothetical protein